MYNHEEICLLVSLDSSYGCALASFFGGFFLALVEWSYGVWPVRCLVTKWFLLYTAKEIIFVCCIPW